MVPAEETEVAVEALLPPGIEVTEDREAFRLALPSFGFSIGLAEACGAPCIAAAGQVVPKPAFTATLEGSQALPRDVASAELRSAPVTLRLRHELDFDPIRPGGGATGEIRLHLSSGEILLDADTVRGSENAFPEGVTLERTLDPGEAVLVDRLVATIELHSPAGEPARVDPSDRVYVEVEPDTLEATAADVRVRGMRVDAPPATFEFGDVDPGTVERVEAGAVIVETENPFEVTGDVTVRLRGAGVDVERTLDLHPGTAERRVDLAPDEIRSLLEAGLVTLTAGGTVDALAQTVRVRPDRSLTVRTRLDVRVAVGGTP